MSAVAVKICDLSQQVFESGFLGVATKLEVLVVSDSSRRTSNMTVCLRNEIKKRALNVAVFETTQKDLTPVFLRGSTRVALIDLSSSNFMSDAEIRSQIIKSFLTVCMAIKASPEELMF